MGMYDIWYRENEAEILENFKTFLRFPSISTDPAFKPQVRACADWVADYLKALGLEVEFWETGGHPTIFAEMKGAGDTLLIYHHYDVQPADPYDLWDSDPFEPTVKDGNIYARGASDNKGQCFYTLTALKAHIELAKEKRINLKLVIEGEEEVGSPGLTKLLTEKRERLKADHLLIIDCDIPAKGMPGITLGARGIVTMEISCRAARADLHSGMHGGLALNPNKALVRALAKIWDKNGQISIPGFYDDVKDLTEEEKSCFDLDLDLDSYQDNMQIYALDIEEGKKPLVSNWLRPTIEINGMTGGYTGEGFKTIIPAEARAKLSCRLPEGMDPEKTAELLTNFLKKELPSGIEVRMDIHHGGLGVRTSISCPGVKLVVKAYEDVFEKSCKYVLTGGSIPIAADLSQAAGCPVIFMGTALMEDAIHSPNEHFGLDRFFQGYMVVTGILDSL